MSNVFNVRRHYLHCMFEASGFLLQIFFLVPMRSQSWNLRSLRRILNFLHSAHIGIEIFLKEHSHVHKSPTFSRDNFIITTLIESKIQMSDLHRQATEGAEFWISCKGPAFLSNFSRLQPIQNWAPSVASRCQCDIRIQDRAIVFFNSATFGENAN